jgi:hypothetical protein
VGWKVVRVLIETVANTIEVSGKENFGAPGVQSSNFG